MAIHHTRLKKAMTLIGEEKEIPKMIQLLSQAEYKDEEIQEILQSAAFQTNGPAKIDDAPITTLAGENVPETLLATIGTTSSPATNSSAKTSKYADFDVFMGQAIIKQYRHISGETRSYITHFQLGLKAQTVRIEPGLAKDFNRFAIGFIDNPGKMYFPKGEKQVGDIQPYNDPTYKPMNETSVTNEFMD